jgi:hypothetical protein
MRLITTMNLCVFVVRCLGVRVTGSEPLTDAVMPPMDEAVRLFAALGAEILGHRPRSATSPSWAPDQGRRTHADRSFPRHTHTAASHLASHTRHGDNQAGDGPRQTNSMSLTDA